MQTIWAGLEQWVDQYATTEDSLSCHGLHGFLTALTICPAEISHSEIINTILGESLPSTYDPQEFNKALDTLKGGIDSAFNDDDFMLSSELEDAYEGALEEWCIGFMAAHFLAEKSWFHHHEQEVCELLLPIMLASSLFNDEPEFRDIFKETQLVDDMYSQIPEVLMELYLMFNSPDDIRNKDQSQRLGKNNRS